MKALALALVFAAGLTPAEKDKPKVKLATIAAIEKIFDTRIQRLADDPFVLLGSTRGVYLEGYGAVFTAEVNLVQGPTLSPFRQAISKEDVERVHARKLERLPQLRNSMREMLLSAAASMDEVPGNEQIVIGVALLYQAYENTNGLPSQILMQGQRSRLVANKLQLLGSGGLDQAIKVQEF